jgi:uncharacterized membrane protein
MAQGSKITVIKDATPERIKGTARIEAFSDGVIAIIITSFL